jgi:hypothetical protein
MECKYSVPRNCVNSEWRPHFHPCFLEESLLPLLSPPPTLFSAGHCIAVYIVGELNVIDL